METLEAIKTRRSVRVYLPQAVEQEKLEIVVKSGNMAACTNLTGGLKFCVITNPELLKIISETGKTMMQQSGNPFLEKIAATPGYSPIYNAPAMVVVSAPATTDPMAMGMNAANAACAAENMLLAATDLGLGSCYLASALLAFQMPDVKRAACIADSWQPACAVVLGYGKGNAPHAPRPENPENIRYVK